MKKVLIALVLCFAGLVNSAHADLLGVFDFEGVGTELVAKSVADNIVISDLNLNNITTSSIEDVSVSTTGMTSSFLLIGGDDTANGTGGAFTNNKILTFTLTNNTGDVLELGSISGFIGGKKIYQYSSARVFSDRQGYDEVSNDTIGVLGMSAGGDKPAETMTINFLDPDEEKRGSNISNSDFAIADGSSITFYMPWIDGSSSDTRYAEIDDIAIYQVPEPATVALITIGGLAILRRKR